MISTAAAGGPNSTAAAGGPNSTAAAGAGWAQYLDTVEAAAHAVREAVLAGRSPIAPDVPAPPGPPPAALDLRRQEVVGLIEDVQNLLAAHRDTVRDRLAALPRAAEQHAQPAGEAFDVTG